MAEVSFNEAINFSRASTATYWGPSGTLLEAAVDEARIQHDPVTGEPLGLLIEPEATNILYPTTFESGFYLGGGFEGTRNAYNDGKFPDGAPLRVTYDGDEPGRLFNISGRYYWPDTRMASRTIDIYVKEGYCRYFSVGSVNGTGTLFDFDNPEYGEYATPVGGVWVRIRRTDPRHGDGTGRRGTSITFGNELINGSLYTQRGDECVIALPSQYNYDDRDDYRPTFSPLPTSDSPVTRAADEVSIDLSDVFNPDEGTIRITAQVPEGEVVASLGDIQVVSDSDEKKSYRMTYSDYAGVPTVSLGNGIHSKLEYFPEAQS